MSGHHHGDDTVFLRAKKGVGSALQKTVQGGKKHAVSIGTATVLGTALSTGISMIQEHWSDQARDKAQAQAIAAAVAPLQVRIDNLAKENDDLKAVNQSQWQSIAKKQDKR